MIHPIVKIGNKDVGQGCEPFIIAEIGSNWKTFDDAKDSIAMFAKCGADAVKFQLFDEPALFGFHLLKDATDPETCTLTIEELRARGSLGPMVGQMPREWIPLLAGKARACNVEFLCTPFSPDLAELINPYVNAHKVASAELSHLRLLHKLNTLGKPVILSTGASGDGDIKQALEVLDKVPVILLYCVSAYPAATVILENIKDMEIMFNRCVGFSDHTLDVYTIPYQAVKQGACILEKTGRLDRVENTPDSDYSLTPDLFQEMVKRIKGQPLRIKRNSFEEKGMILKHNRRLIATKAINPGDTLIEGVNFGAYRSLKEDTHALSPFAIDANLKRGWKGVNGGKVCKPLRPGDGIGPGDFSWE